MIFASNILYMFTCYAGWVIRYALLFIANNCTTQYAILNSSKIKRGLLIVISIPHER